MQKAIITAGLLAMAARVMAQSPVDGSHYPAGLNGIKGGTLPGPGIYLRDDNWFYYGTGGGLLNYKTFEYLQAPQLTWMTGWTVLGANVGMDLELPIIYRQASYNLPKETNPNGNYSFYPTVSGYKFGLGDIKIEPLLLSWHWQHFDTTLAYALWVPSGEYSAGSLASLGDDDWTHMFTLGGVWYPDAKKSWAVSILNHFEFNSSQVGSVAGSGVTPGGGYSSPATYQKIPCSTYTLEWSVSKMVLTNTDVGLSGYYQKQFTDSSATADAFENSEGAGIGPEISASIPRWNLTASLRYAYEFTAYDRPQGHMVTVTISKGF